MNTALKNTAGRVVDLGRAPVTAAWNGVRHMPRKQLLLYGGLGAAAAMTVIEWPVAVAVAAGTEVARRVSRPATPSDATTGDATAGDATTGDESASTELAASEPSTDPAASAPEPSER